MQENIRILEAMDSKYIDDVLPLICVEKNELEKFKSILDVQELDSEHPIYYFSEKLKVISMKIYLDEKLTSLKKKFQ